MNAPSCATRRGAERAILAALAAAVLLAGCGQRGPLYLPDQPPPKKRLVDQAADTPPARALAPLSSSLERS